MSFLNSHDVRIEVSNPQYYPDDSAPPIPNISLSRDAPNGGSSAIAEDEIISVGDIYRHSDNDGDPNNYLHMKGVPATRNYSSVNGVETTTGDHLFYNHLNVTSTVPTFKVKNAQSLETYFRELLPAVCGLANYKYFGANGVPVLSVHQAHDLDNSFVIQSVSNRVIPKHQYYTPEDYPTSIVWDTTTLHGQSTTSHTFDEMEFVLRFQNKFIPGKRGESNIIIGNIAYQIHFRVTYDPADYGSGPGSLNFQFYYWFYDMDYDGDDERPITFSGIGSRSYPYPHEADFKGDYSYVVVRLGETFSSYVNYGDIFTYQDFGRRTSAQDGGFPQISYVPQTVWIDRRESGTNPPDYTIPMTLEVIGRNDSTLSPSVSDLLEKNIHPDTFNSYYPLYGEDNNTKFPFVFPKHNGNIWEYANKVATNLPFESKVL